MPNVFVLYHRAMGISDKVTITRGISVLTTLNMLNGPTISSVVLVRSSSYGVLVDI